MKLIELNPWIQSLGWTLLHSLWQGLIIFLLITLMRKIFPRAASSFKYLMGTGSLLLILVTSAITFGYLYLPHVSAVPVKNEGIPFTTTFVPSIMLDSPVQSASLWINRHLDALVVLWLTGIMFLSFRWIAGWWYSQRWQKGALPVAPFWEEKLQALAESLGVRQAVSLLQSPAVTSPVLLGFFKPVILLPIGMVSGLSIEQVETILLHELAHIRRHDYLVNFIQSVTEVIFFFNPWVWIISSQVRFEREQCCDDVVVGLKNPLAYAQALHQLEATRLLNLSLALGAGGRKNQLLQRIKRIMKTTERKEEGRGKMFFAFLMILALVGASWLSVQAYQPKVQRGKVAKSDIHRSDTTKKDRKEKSASYSRKSITTDDEKGVPQVWTTVETDGDEDLIPEIPDDDFEIPPIPSLEEIDEITPMAELAEIPEIESFSIDFDTVPGGHFRHRSSGDWEAFGQQFTEQFSERFSDFYQKNKPEFDKMMKDLDGNMEKMQEQLSHLVDGRMERQMARMAPMREEAMRRQTDHMRRRSDDMGHRAEAMASRMKSSADRMQVVEDNRAQFEKVMAVELIKDGYLGKNEEIKSLSWSNESIEVNGKKIKDQDKTKYRELRKKFFRNKRSHHAE